MTKRYGHLTALDDVGFSIRRGEILGLIGPNGAGKTTLFECMAAVLPPTAGALLLQGRPLSASVRRQTLFYLPDAVHLARADSQLGPRLHDWIPGGGINVRPSSTGWRFSAPGKRDWNVVRDGGSGSARIGLLTAQPLLLADEPFEGLDLRQSRGSP
jgi:ABC-2 type transport system ATP-binding protein